VINFICISAADLKTARWAVDAAVGLALTANGSTFFTRAGFLAGGVIVTVEAFETIDWSPRRRLLRDSVES